MRFHLLAITAPAVLLGACNTFNVSEHQKASKLIRSDASVAGTVRVSQQARGVRIRIDAIGLPPGTHAMHVHSAGRCDPADFATAGPHWNPTDKQHGRANSSGWHLGDLGNVEVDAAGRLKAGLLLPGVNLHSRGAPGRPVLLDEDGAALVIHARADDERTDPSGNSGERIACAVL